VDNESPSLELLHIDDDTTSLEIIATILRMRYPSMQVYSAETAEAGLALFKNHKHDIVITDIHLPSADGIHVVTEIKRISKTQVIILSGDSGIEYEHKLDGLGINHLISKPVGFSQLFAAIDDSIRAVS
jgi:DNA-binding NarL/FixJ family response regulator